MMIVVERDALLATLTPVAAVIERITTIPIISNVLIEARDGQIHLTGTNLAAWRMTDCPYQGESLRTTLPAATLMDILRKAPSGSQMEIKQADTEGALATVAIGRARYRLPSLPPSDFPGAKQVDTTQRYAVAGADLVRLIDSTQHAVSTEDVRYWLNGVRLEVENGRLTAAATNGHILAAAYAPAPQGADGMPGIIISRSSLKAVRDFAKDAAEIEIATDGALLELSGAGGAYVTKLVDGTYPDWRRVVPRNESPRLEASASDLAAAVEQALLVVTTASENPEHNFLRLAQGAGDQIRISVHASNGADGEVEASATFFPGDGWETSANGRYLLATLGIFGTARITIEQEGRTSAMRISAADNDGLEAVLMPARG